MAGRRAAGRRARPGMVRCCPPPAWLPGGEAGCAGRAAGSGCSVGGLPVEPSAGMLLMVMMDAVGWLGGSCHCFGCCEAEFGGPALDARPEPVAFVRVFLAGEVGEDHGGDGG